MRAFFGCFMLGISLALSGPALGQVYPPGTFSVDGVPVVCGSVAFVLDPSLPDVGMARPGVIILNPMYYGGMSTSAKLFWVGHECGHHVVGLNESAADCWAVRTGRDQGWFPPSTFQEMIYQMQNNPGDFYHPPGAARIANMISCYQSP